MSEQENKELVQRTYQYFGEGNIASLLNSLSKNINWQLPEIENVPFAGKRHGRDRVAQFFSELTETQDVLEFAPHEFIAQGDRVVVLGTYLWRIKSSGTEYGGDWAHVWTVENGMLTDFHEYMDTAAARKAYTAAQAA